MSDGISEPGKISKNYSEPFEAYWETIFDYGTSEISQTITDYIAEYISIRKKISKNYSQPFKAYWETIFDESVSEVNRQQSNYMSDDISYPGKIIGVISGIFEATFDYSTTEPNQKIVGLSSLIDILHGKISTENFQSYRCSFIMHAWCIMHGFRGSQIGKRPR